MSEIEDLVRSLAEPVLVRHGATLVDVQVKQGRTQLVRIVVDREDGIDLETCARVSSELSLMLDVQDPIPGRYTLEVTSPGVTRPLKTAADFRRNIGRRARIVLERGQHEGEIVEVTDDAVRLGEMDEPIPLAAVRAAKIVLPW